MVDLLLLPRPVESLQNSAGFKMKTFSKLCLLNRKKMTLAPWSLLCQNNKGRDRQSQSRDCDLQKCHKKRKQYLSEKDEGLSKSIKWTKKLLAKEGGI